ncbi:MAG: hypothetical protein GC138_08230 [Gammaproteobacteria bacterium]|nr:hypothetical protein [Gammaproteobacteria bacterium]
MNKLRFPAVVLLFCLVVPFSLAEAAGGILKPDHDQRQFTTLVLANGLKAVLVSDPDADKAAASLVVHTGSMDDPDDRPGLAHFLEHMLFLGTKKYPDPDSYHDFISAHGGRDNAFTADEYTNFHFEVDYSALAETLDHFAQFFIAPTFDAKYVDRERHAVDSEYHLRIKDDGRRLWQVLKATSNPDHPFAHFSVGSLETLDDRPDRPVRDDLIAFYRKHYAAQGMTLAVVGREPLAQMKKIVSDLFSQVPDHEVEQRKAWPPFFRQDQLGISIEARPIKTERSVEVYFPYPWQQGDYLTKPATVIGQLVGHEGDGSLLALLKRRGWANGISAGRAMKAGNEAMFTVEVDLTEAGLAEVEQVKDLIFSYFNLLKQAGVQPWFVDELRTVNDLKFRFRDQPTALSEAIGLADNLQRYPENLVLKGPFVIAKQDPARIKDILAHMIPANARVVTVAPGGEFEQREPWYQTPYRVTPLGEARLGAWGAMKPDPELALPAPNPFIPEQLKLLKAKSVAHKPEVILHGDGFEIWHQQDVQFEVPKAEIFWGMTSPNVGDGPRDRMLASLWTDLANDALNPHVYPAELAGLHYNLGVGRTGFAINVGGFNDKEARLLSLVLDTFLNLKVDDERFAVIKERALESLRNQALDKPFIQAGRYLPELLVHDVWGADSLLAVLEGISADDLRAYIPKARSGLYVRSLIHGNIALKDARALSQEMLDKIFQNANPVQPVEREVVHLDPGHEYAFRRAVDNDDSAISVYYQGERDDIAQEARMALLHQFIRAPFFNQLRTEQQLGYVVYSGQAVFDRVPGITFVVQSPKLSPDDLLTHIDRFLAGFSARIESMDPAEFEQGRSGLLSTIEKRATRLSERTHRYLGDLSLKYLDFDHRERLADAVRGIDQKTLAEFAKALLTPDDKKRLLVEMYGNPYHDLSQRWVLGSGRVFVADGEVFRRSLPAFILPEVSAAGGQ